MAMLVLLLPEGAADFVLGAASVEELSGLGITRLAVVRDERATGVMLEGWAFDPASSGAAVMAALGQAHGEVRVLHPVAELSVLPQRGVRADGEAGRVHSR